MVNSHRQKAEGGEGGEREAKRKGEWRRKKEEARLKYGGRWQR